jgi:hypothetical protein
MTKQHKPVQSNIPTKTAGKRVRTSVLVAAASLLGTSIGFTAGTPTDTTSSPDKNAVKTGTTDRNVELAEVKVHTVTPNVHVNTGTNQSKFGTNQSKFGTNQIKEGTNQSKFGTDQVKGSLITNQQKN